MRPRSATVRADLGQSWGSQQMTATGSHQESEARVLRERISSWWRSRQQSAVQRELEAEAKPRLRGAVAWLVRILSIFMSLFLLYTAFFGEYPPAVQRGVPLLIAALLIFICYPARGHSSLVRLVDGLFMIASLVSIGYLLFQYQEIADRIGGETALDTAIAIVGTLVTLEITRRTTGMALPIIALVFIIYAFFGQYIPGNLGHQGYGIERTFATLWLGQDGIFGMALGIIASFVYLFVLFGAFLDRTGAGKFFTDLAYAATGRIRSGPAQAAVISSAFFGTLSGSAVANVATTGTFTIPLMKSKGYAAHFAGAVEAVASSGGQIMPPIMGAAAFLMAEVTGIPYTRVITAAAIPAVLYYIGVAAAAELEARRTGLRPYAAEDLPKARQVLKWGWVYLLPVVALVYFLFGGYSPGRAAFFAIGITLFICVVVQSETRLRAGPVLDALERGPAIALSLFSAMACIGIVIAMATMTGLGVKFAEIVMQVAGQSLLLALVLTMVASLVMGMGLPTVACYILLAIVVGPAMAKLGLPVIASHLFIFYFGIISAITPPVALAAYTGAGIAGSDPFKTGWTACRLGLPAFIVPYMFVYGPALLLIGSPEEILAAAVTATVGTVALAMATIGFGVVRAATWERLLLLVGALLLIKPGLLTDAAGLVLLCAVLGRQHLLARRMRAKREAPSLAQ